MVEPSSNPCQSDGLQEARVLNIKYCALLTVTSHSLVVAIPFLASPVAVQKRAQTHLMIENSLPYSVALNFRILEFPSS